MNKKYLLAKRYLDTYIVELGSECCPRAKFMTFKEAKTTKKLVEKTTFKSIHKYKIYKLTEVK